MMDIEREKLWYRLCNIREIGSRTAQKLLEYAGGIEDLMSMSTEMIENSGICSQKILSAWNNSKYGIEQLEYEYDTLVSRGIKFVSIEHEDYPEKLKLLSDAPFGLWYKGKLHDSTIPTAAIIGSRSCSSYGRELAGVIGKKLAELGVCVISGMALGIDAAGQRGCMDNGGISTAVLGSGVNVCYPRDNYALYEKLCEKGCVLSEQPLGMQGLPANFVTRNRIISGLSDCVIIVEAREKSGTQLTCTYALDQGKEIFAVPGRITDGLSRGCNQMISQGARILYDLSELAEYFKKDDVEITEKVYFPELTDYEKMIYDRLTYEPRHIEEIMQETGLPVSDVMQILLNLEIKGVVYQQIKNYYRRCILIK